MPNIFLLSSRRLTAAACALAAAQYALFKAELAALIDPEADSLRFYRLGNSYKTKVDHIGLTPPWPQDEVLLV